MYVTNASHSAYVNIASNSSLTLDGGLLQLDNLILTNGGIFNDLAGTLIFSNSFQLENGGGVTLSNSTITTTNNFTIAVSQSSTGFLAVVDGGALNVTNATLGIANDGSLTNGAGSGLVTVSNASLTASTINLWSTAGGSGAFIVQSNSVANVDSNLTVVSGSLSTTSMVTVAGATLSVTNGTIAIGPSGSGRMTISGGSVTARQIALGGNAPGSSGTLIVGGHLKLLTSLSANLAIVGVGQTNGGGGDIDGNGSGCIFLAQNHNGEMLVLAAGQVTNVGDIFVGYTPGFVGALTNGGVVEVKTNLIVGNYCPSGMQGALGFVALTNGGSMFVTNAYHTAVLDVRNGTFLMSGGTLVVDNLVVTNPCGHFIKMGGTIVYNNPLAPAPVLDPNQDADGDGMLNWQEWLAGTDPLDPSSVFEMLSATVTNQNVLLSWTTEGGHSYVLQTSTNPAAGAFHDFGPVITNSGAGPGATNYLVTGAATNRSSYYRVRLGP
jgi:hypothetical protein